MPGSAVGRSRRPADMAGRYSRAVPSAMTAVPPRAVRVAEQLLYKLGRRFGEPTLADGQLATHIAGLDTGGTVPRLASAIERFENLELDGDAARENARRFGRERRIYKRLPVRLRADCLR
jgi:hypothetical protein